MYVVMNDINILIKWYINVNQIISIIVLYCKISHGICTLSCNCELYSRNHINNGTRINLFTCYLLYSAKNPNELHALQLDGIPYDITFKKSY